MGMTRNLRDGVLVINDGGGSPETLTIAVDEGDIRIEEVSNAVEVLDRGVLDHVREGDQEPVTVEFSLKFQEFIADTGAASPTPYEALRKIGNASAWASTRGVGEKYCLNLIFTIASPAGAPNEVVTLADFYHTRIAFAEGADYNTLSVSGRAWITTPSVAKSTW